MTKLKHGSALKIAISLTGLHVQVLLLLSLLCLYVFFACTVTFVVIHVVQITSPSVMISGFIMFCLRLELR